MLSMMTGHAMVGSLRSLIPVVAVLSLASCCSPYSQQLCCQPTTCPAAIEGFTRYEPVVTALDRYKQLHGAYPSTLEVLMLEQPGAWVAGDRDQLTYLSADDGTYTLEFTYYGPGANRCWRTSEMVNWDCTGYF